MKLQEQDRLWQEWEKAHLARSRAETKHLEAAAKSRDLEKAYRAAEERENRAFEAWRSARDAARAATDEALS